MSHRSHRGHPSIAQRSLGEVAPVLSHDTLVWSQRRASSSLTVLQILNELAF